MHQVARGDPLHVSAMACSILELSLYLDKAGAEIRRSRDASDAGMLIPAPDLCLAIEVNIPDRDDYIIWGLRPCCRRRLHLRLQRRGRRWQLQ